MTPDDLIEAMARAMRRSKAWPVVFSSGSAEELSRAALRAITEAGCAVVPAVPSQDMEDAAWDAHEAYERQREGAWIGPISIFSTMVAAGRVDGGA